MLCGEIISLPGRRARRQTVSYVLLLVVFARLNRNNILFGRTPMKLLFRCHTIFFAALLVFAGASPAQTVRVDISAAKAIPFDPDQSLGSSLDILPAKQFEKVFAP